RQPDEVVVLEAVAAQECLVVGVVSQAQGELGLAAGLQPSAVLAAVAGDRLEHHAALVDLDRVDALVVRAVAGLLDGPREGLVDAVQAVLDDVGEAQNQRQVVSLLAQVVDHGDERHAALPAVGDGHLTGLGDAEVTGRPGPDAVELVGVRDAETWVEACSAHSSSSGAGPAAWPVRWLSSAARTSDRRRSLMPARVR